MEQIDKLLPDFMKLQAEQGNMKTNAVNAFANNHRYVKADVMLKELRPVLASHNFCLSFKIGYMAETDKDILTAELIHTSGQKMQSQLSLRLKGDNPQDQGGAITYGIRYLTMALLGIAPTEDDDANEASGKGTPAAKPASKPKDAPKAKKPAEKKPEPPPPIQDDSEGGIFDGCDEPWLDGSPSKGAYKPCTWREIFEDKADKHKWSQANKCYEPTGKLGGLEWVENVVTNGPNEYFKQDLVDEVKQVQYWADELKQKKRNDQTQELGGQLADNIGNRIWEGDDPEPELDFAPAGTESDYDKDFDKI